MGLPSSEDFWLSWQRILLHWELVDAFLGVDRAFAVHGSLLRTQAAADFARHRVLEDHGLAVEVDDAVLAGREWALRRRLVWVLKAFRRVARVGFPADPRGRCSRAAPSALAGWSVLLEASGRALVLWELWDAAPPGHRPGPLVLPDGTDRAALLALRRDFYAVVDARLDVEMERVLGVAEEGLIREHGERWIPVYRATVPGLLPRDHFLARALPRYSPRARVRRVRPVVS